MHGWHRAMAKLKQYNITEFVLNLANWNKIHSSQLINPHTAHVDELAHCEAYLSKK